MSAATDRSRIQRAITLITGIVLIAATFLIEGVLRVPGMLKVVGIALVVFGCVLIGLGVVMPHDRVRSALAKSSLLLLSILSVLGLAEATFRAIGFDFDIPNPAVPIFNRGPSVHIGDGVLRRPGPAVWRGRPLTSIIHFCWGNRDAYPDEQEIEVRYDKSGFRNPPSLADWEVVVTGDSFVESGYLPYEDIFTTLAAKRLGIRIKNLGVSDTGTIFQTAYVRKYGKALSTRQAVLCFFDGNDVNDLVHESQETNFIRRTGHRMKHPKQTSLLAAVFERLERLRQKPTSDKQEGLKPNATFVASSREHMVAIRPILPPRWEDLTKDRQDLVAAALTNWSVTVRSLGMQPWVMCIPDSRRVLNDRLHYVDTNNILAHWRASQFGPHISKICADIGIRFIDTYPALRREVEAGSVPYNLFVDAHLSRHGSHIVAQVMAKALGADAQNR